MKIVIHLGFPKTASSNLQFGPLLEYEKHGLLNLKTWRKNNKKEDLKFRPSSRLFTHKNILPDYLNFLNNKVNVLSDESFTSPMRLRKCNYGNDIADPFTFPEKIRTQIQIRYPNESLEITWLAFIRNQSELIQSQYVEEYNWKRFKNIDLLFSKQGHIDLSGYEIYNYNKYFKTVTDLADKHNDSVCFLLFEDIISDSSYIFKKLGHIFEIDYSKFQKKFEQHHVNKKQKSKFGTFTKDGKYFVPKLSPHASESIMNIYYDDNASLNKYYDSSKLSRYGYIRPN